MEGDGESGGGAIGVRDDESLGEGRSLEGLLVREDGEVGWVDEGDDEGAGRVAAVVASVAEDCQLGLAERLLYPSIRQNTIRTADSVCSRRDSPISPATSLSSPEKTISQPSNSLAMQFLTTTSSTSLGIGVVCFHLTAFLYAWPAEREDAPRAWILKKGWAERRTMNLHPASP